MSAKAFTAACHWENKHMLGYHFHLVSVVPGQKNGSMNRRKRIEFLCILVDFGNLEKVSDGGTVI